MRRIIYILLLLCLPVYGFAMQGGLPHAYGLGSLAHEVEHDEGIQHHHEDDGSIHYDESDESFDHAQDHSSSQQPAGASLPTPAVVPEQLVSSLTVFMARAAPEPFLDGPRKPPRPSPGHAAGGSLHA